MPKKRILLVEDNDLDAEITRMKLDESGVPHILTVVNTGAKAIDTLRNSPKFHHVFLDLMLPDMDGSRVLEYIKSDDRINTATTVLSGKKPPKKALDLADDYIPKPLPIDYFAKENARRDDELADLKKWVDDKKADDRVNKKIRTVCITVVTTFFSGCLWLGGAIYDNSKAVEAGIKAFWEVLRGSH